jgi:hypothetical protein
MDNPNEFREIQSAVNNILNVKSITRRKKKNDLDKKKELFFQIILGVEQLNVRQSIMFSDLSVDFSNYDEPFFKIIDQLFQLHFGSKPAGLIDFYLYDRINQDGTINPIMTEDGKELFIQDAYQLWDLLELIMTK